LLTLSQRPRCDAARRHGGCARHNSVSEQRTPDLPTGVCSGRFSDLRWLIRHRHPTENSRRPPPLGNAFSPPRGRGQGHRSGPFKPRGIAEATAVLSRRVCGRTRYEFSLLRRQGATTPPRRTPGMSSLRRAGQTAKRVFVVAIEGAFVNRSKRFLRSTRLRRSHERRRWRRAPSVASGA